MKLIIVLLSSLFVVQNCAAQDNNSIAITPIAGINISTASQEKLKGNFYGIEGSYQISMAHYDADWVRMLHVKSVSIAATYIDVQNLTRNGVQSTKGIIGNMYSLSSRLNISLWNSGSTRLLISPGLGLAYVTQTFYTNKNFVFGSHVNAVLQLGAKMETSIGPSTSLQFGVNVQHYSNACTQMPNNGINTLLATLGVVQQFSSKGPTHIHHSQDSVTRHSFEFGIGAGRRDVVKTGIFKNPAIPGQWFYYDTTGIVRKTRSNLYQIGMYAGYNYRLNPVIGLKAGSDVVYYTHPFTYDNFLNTYQSSFSSYDHFSVGLSAGVDIWLGRFAVTGTYGRYVHFNSLLAEHGYWTGGIKYHVLPWLALNTKVYWHGGQSHYANFGVVFSSKKVFH
ncbi:MAG: acyloxyacyl hydrolase [Candidatus Paceibacterota bacterium]